MASELSFTRMLEMNPTKMKTIQLTGCKNGLGMKIIGGIDENGNYTGVFVKQILEDGLVDKTGKVNLGDMIYSVNGYDLTQCSQKDAIRYLRLASQTGNVELIIDKSVEAQRLFVTLFESSMTSSHSADSARDSISIDETCPVNCKDVNGKLSNGDTINQTIMSNLRIGNISVGSSSGSGQCPSVDSGIPGSTTFMSPGPDDFQTDLIKTIVIDYRTSLGISICGGVNDVNGPNVYIAEVIPGGDVHHDGNLGVGDILISINGEQYVGVTNQRAKATLSRLKLEKGVKSYSISYISKYQTLPARFSVNTSHENNLALSFFPSKNGSPKVPASKTNNSHQARSREATPERLKTLQNMCSPKGLSSLPGNLDGKDEVLLKELADLIEDIQDSDENSDMDEDNVFVSDPFSPNVISTPYSSKNISIRGSPPENTIPHYLKRDVNQENDEISPKKIKRLALNANTNIKLEKLEGALQHLGVAPSVCQIEEIRKRLHFDVDGFVAYGDFVEATRGVLGTTGLVAHSKTMVTPTLKFQRSIAEVQQKPATSTTDMMSYKVDVSRLRRERDEALRESEYYRSILHDKDHDCCVLEDELERTKRQVVTVRRECSIMRRQTHKVIETHKNPNREADKAIRRLEKENAILRSKHASTCELTDAQKRLVVVGCQLRKSEVSKRAYEVAVDRLTKFVERVHLQLKDNGEATTVKKQARRRKELSEEARETVKSVKMLLEEEPLPFGWEEVYTPDGARYYMNHVTQTTSWIHPVSHVSRKLKNKEARMLLEKS